MVKRALQFLVGEKTSTRLALVVFFIPSVVCLGYGLAGQYFGVRVNYEPSREIRNTAAKATNRDISVSPVVKTGERVSDASILLLVSTITLRNEAFSGQPCSTVLELQQRMIARKAVPPGFKTLPDGGFETGSSRFGIRMDPKNLRVEVFSLPVLNKGPIDFAPPFLVRLPFPDKTISSVPGDEPFAELIWNDGRVKQPGSPPAFLSLSDLKAYGWKTEQIRLTAKDRKEGIQ